MVYYFRLQFRMLNRYIAELGIHPSLGFLLAAIAFLGFSFYLFDETDYAAYPYLYALAALGVVARLSESKRNDLLRTVFSTKEYLGLRVLENTGIVLPFVLFLVFKKALWVALGVLLVSIVLVFTQFSPALNRSIPTPFSRFPFEFSVGFRKTIPVYLLSYFLTFQALVVGNFGLGVFSLLLLLLLAISHYTDPENTYYVWIYSFSPGRFLWAKVKTALWYFTITCLPVLLALGFSFTEKIGYLLLALGLGYLYLIAVILAKYTAFPARMNLPQAILLAIAVWFPPILVGIIPFFYTQAVKKLKKILT